MQPDQVLIPATLGEMLKKVLSPLEKASNPGWVDYACGWITGAAERHYRSLVMREHEKGLGQQVVHLLCELAIAHAIIQWHEVRDAPPPMPDLRKVDSLF